MSLGKEITGTVSFSSHRVKSTNKQQDMNVEVAFDHLDEVKWGNFYAIKLLFIHPPLPYYTLWKEASMY